MAEAPREVADQASASPTTRLVAPLDAFDAGDLASAGGKGANLGELIHAGFRVPGGFIVTTDAYTAVVERTGLSARIDEYIREGSGADDEAAAAIRDAFGKAEVPEDVRAAIVDAYGGLDDAPVAVRSSATAEDLPGAAFAGQQDTSLNVVGADAVVEAVQRCWASLWTDRAISYRRRRGIDSSGVRIAVVVQTMVEADIAGVMFTANAVTGARDELVVDASAGLGESVVSGIVTPDHYVLDRQGQVRDWNPGRNEVVIRGKAGGGVTHDEATDAEPQRLTDAQLAELARLGVSVAEHYGRPQDIEWAYADGQLWLLQARPLTALPPPPIELNRIQRALGPQIIEMLPVRPYPMDISGWILPGPGGMIVRMLDEMAGVRLDLSEALPEVDGVVDRFVPPMPRPTARTLTALFRNIRRIRRFHPADWTDDPRFEAFEQGVRELDEPDPAAMSWAELVRVPRQALDLVGIMTDLRVDYSPRAGGSLVRLRLTLRARGLGGTAPSLTLGVPTRTEDANRALSDLADQVRADPALRDRFAELDAERLVEEVERAPEFADFRAALDVFFDEYGHRETASPLLVSSPTWIDAPEAVLGTVKALLDGHGAAREPATSGDEALERLMARPRVRWTRSRKRLRRNVETARAGISFREDTHFHGTRPLPALRRALLEMGQRLVDAGILDSREDVLHLRLEELESAPEPSALSEAEAERMRRAVLGRAARRDELAGVPLISAAVLFPDSAADDADTLVAGTAAGGGRATGPARVIREAADFGRLRSGDILVCPYTNPAWTPLFQQAAAVVVDTGSPGSHAAIVAREYGIPAVMGTGTGTATLADDQMITVDGDHGRVTAAE